MKYICTFQGRTIGAIGIFQRFRVPVEADTEDAARLKLYDDYDHITQFRALPADGPSLYQECLELAVPIDSHESDLYIQASVLARELLKKHGKAENAFISQVDGRVWFDVPFAFDPWWQSKAASAR